jgi:hypothetical protein
MRNDPTRMRLAQQECREMVQADVAAEYCREWAGGLEDCALCGEQLLPELGFFADTETYPDERVWGLLCPVCLTYGGNKMEWGKGQLYQYRADLDGWLMVAGFPPRHLWTNESSMRYVEHENVIYRSRSPWPMPMHELLVRGAWIGAGSSGYKASSWGTRMTLWEARRFAGDEWPETPKEERLAKGQ